MIERRTIDGKEVDFDTELGGAVMKATPVEEANEAPTPTKPARPRLVPGIHQGHDPARTQVAVETVAVESEPKFAPAPTPMIAAPAPKRRIENADIPVKPIIER